MNAKHQRQAGENDGVSFETAMRWSAEEERRQRIGVRGVHRVDSAYRLARHRLAS